MGAAACARLSLALLMGVHMLNVAVTKDIVVPNADFGDYIDDAPIQHREATPDGSTAHWRPAYFSDENFMTLTADNFTQARAMYPRMLVFFYAPWCSHSLAVISEFAQAADQLAESRADVRLAQVDATQQVALADEYKIEGYPTMYWFSSSSAPPRNFPLRGNHKAKEMVAWVMTRLLPPSVELESTAAATTIAKSLMDDPHRLGLVIWLSTEQSLLPSLEQAATTLSDRAAIAFTFDRAVYQQALATAVLHGHAPKALLDGEEQPCSGQRGGGAASEGGCAVGFLTKPHDERVTAIPPTVGGEALAAVLGRMVVAHLLPEIVPFTERYEDALLEGDVSLQLVLISPPDAANPYEDALRQAARSHAGHVLVVFADSTSDVTDGLMEYFGVPLDSSDVHFFGLDVRREIKYATDPLLPSLRNEPLVAALDGFLASLRDGSASKLIRSQPRPADDKGPLVEIVGDSFDELVRQSAKDVLLEVYAPWCGHCKKLEPTYEQLARRYADVPSVTIARMDGTANEVPGVHVDGYPTLVLYTASGQRVEAGEEVEMSVEGIARFIEEHAELPIDAASVYKEEL